MAELRAANEGRRGRLRTAVITAGMLGAGCVAAFGLGVPAARAQADPSPGYATQPFTPKSFRMPQGQGCTGDVARWQAVQTNDYASGNIGLKVYHQIQADIVQADAACRAGRDREASAMIHASKRRHGYPD